jgi:hypothetical protein
MGKPNLSTSENHKFSQRLRAFIHSEWGKVVRDIVIAVAAAIIGYFIPVLIQSYQRRPFAKMWAALLRDQKTVPIIIADVPAQEFAIPRFHTKSRLPANVPLLGLQDALGVSELTSKLSEAGWAPQLHTTEESGVLMHQYSFVSIGGPSVNGATYELVASCEEVANGGRGKVILHGNMLDSKLIIFYPSHEVEDLGTSPPGKFMATKSNSGLSVDYGFIEIGPNKYVSGQYTGGQNAIAVFGLWPPGTQAAIDALIYPDTSSVLGKRMQSMIKNNQPLVAVVEVSVTNLSTPNPPMLVAVRPLEPKNSNVTDQTCVAPSKHNAKAVSGTSDH